jgi:hypothetical protein
MIALNANYYYLQLVIAYALRIKKMRAHCKIRLQLLPGLQKIATQMRMIRIFIV